ncbi:MAG: glycoside hydrolase family 9 protein, partial [Oscillospiraceae bacterium]|nr:glycoside hydrolase family 9 protein [Oscillospiraceae bacterium]
MKKNLRRGVAAICSLAMLASVLSCGMTVNALDQETPKESYDRQLLGETDFDYKILPWHTVEAAPAKQNFEITSDGELHVMILSATGADKEKWDLQVRHRNLSFRAGKTYEIEVKVKAKRAGMQLTSQISTVSGDEYYCVLDEDKFMNGPYMGGKWGSCARLTTEYQTIKGEFTPTRDIDGAEWNFQYARGTMYEGNAQEGDELWFDYMSIIEKDSTGDPYYSDYGYTTRKFSGLENNYISVNQVGYFPNGKKVAVLGDNGGDITPDEINASEYKNDKISLTAPVEFEVIDAGSGKSVFKGLSSAPSRDADSGDTVCKLDFSEFTTPGTYFIKSGDWRSFDFSISGDIYSEKGHGLLTNAVNYFYQNRSADDIEEKYITSGNKAELAHKGEHKTDTAAVQKIWKKEYLSREEAAVTYKSSSITANGGWYESASHRKNMVSGGMALWTLQNMYERASIEGNAKFDDGSGTVIVPENNNKIPDILDETAFELEWMEQMKVAEDEPTWGESAAGLFYHEISDQRWAGIALKPWDYIDEYDNIVRIAKPPTFAATLNYAACAAQAARLWAPYDSAKAERYLDKAMDAYNAYLPNYYEADMTRTTHPYYVNECAKEELNESSLYASDWQSVTGPYSAYGDDYVDDDAYWAACEIFVSASEMKNENAEKFKKELEKFKDAYKVSSRVN